MNNSLADETPFKILTIKDIPDPDPRIPGDPRPILHEMLLSEEWTHIMGWVLLNQIRGFDPSSATEKEAVVFSTKIKAIQEMMDLKYAISIKDKNETLSEDLPEEASSDFQPDDYLKK